MSSVSLPIRRTCPPGLPDWINYWLAAFGSCNGAYLPGRRALPMLRSMRPCSKRWPGVEVSAQNCWSTVCIPAPGGRRLTACICVRRMLQHGTRGRTRQQSVRRPTRSKSWRKLVISVRTLPCWGRFVLLPRTPVNPALVGRVLLNWPLQHRCRSMHWAANLPIHLTTRYTTARRVLPQSGAGRSHNAVFDTRYHIAALCPILPKNVPPPACS